MVFRQKQSVRVEISCSDENWVIFVTDFVRMQRTHADTDALITLALHNRLFCHN